MNWPSTILDAASGLRTRAFSAVELVEQSISVADRLEPTLHAYVTRFDDTALSTARAADRAFARGVDRGPLQGVPVGVKDIVLTEEAPTTGGSRVHNPAWHERRDATVVRLLREAGAVITGKTTTLELAIGYPTTALCDGRNPWDPKCWAGGSSTGSAAGVGAMMFLGAVGTDTGGSIRVPAAYCGVSGLRPTFGRVSRADVIPLSPSLDTVGPMARTAADLAAMLRVMAGRDPRDPSTVEPAASDFESGLGQSVKGLRIGVERKHHVDDALADPELGALFDRALAELEHAGAVLRDVELPYYDEGVNAALVAIYADGLAHHAKELGEQWQAFDPSSRSAFATGALFNGGDYVLAQKVRRALRRLVMGLYDDVDLIVSTTSVTAAPQLEGSGLPATMSSWTDTCRTVYWSVVGNPVVSIPMGFTTAGMPLGLQIAGRYFDEATVLRVADAFQRATDWHLRLPPSLKEDALERVS